MVYNPIFEEEVENKSKLIELKRDITKRAQKEMLKRAISRIYRLFQKKSPASMINEVDELTLKRA